MKIEVSPAKATDFFKAIAAQYHAEVVGNRFELPPHIGKGGGSFYELEDGLSFFLYDLQLHDDSTLLRKAVDHSIYFPIICWFSFEKIEQKTDGDKKIVSKDSPYSIFMPSPKIESSYTIPAKTRLIIITITITPEWLKRHLINQQESALLKLIDSNKAFFIHEEISFNMSQYLESLKTFDTENMVSMIQLRSDVLNFLALFLASVENREGPNSMSSINRTDVEKLFAIRKKMNEEYATHHEIKKLAADAAMSESKLQKLFKDVFGITIYQYALKVKIEAAKKMIATKKYSIAEVGHNIGYSNMSHFTAAFKKQIGLNPKQYLQELK